MAELVQKNAFCVSLGYRYRVDICWIWVKPQLIRQIGGADMKLCIVWTPRIVYPI